MFDSPSRSEAPFKYLDEEPEGFLLRYTSAQAGDVLHSLEEPVQAELWADLFSAPCAGRCAHLPTKAVALGYLKATVPDYGAHPCPSLLLPCSCEESLGIASIDRWAALMLSGDFTQGNLLLGKIPVENHPFL